MGIKMLFTAAFVFFLIYRQTADPVMLFCVFYSIVLAVCMLGYKADNLDLIKKRSPTDENDSLPPKP